MANEINNMDENQVQDKLTIEDIRRFAKTTASAVDDGIIELGKLEKKINLRKEELRTCETPANANSEVALEFNRKRTKLREEIKRLEEDQMVSVERTSSLEHACDIYDELLAFLTGEKITYRKQPRLNPVGDISKELAVQKKRIDPKVLWSVRVRSIYAPFEKVGKKLFKENEFLQKFWALFALLILLVIILVTTLTVRSCAVNKAEKAAAAEAAQQAISGYKEKTVPAGVTSGQAASTAPVTIAPKQSATASAVPVTVAATDVTGKRIEFVVAPAPTVEVSAKTVYIPEAPTTLTVEVSEAVRYESPMSLGAKIGYMGSLWKGSVMGLGARTTHGFDVSAEFRYTVFMSLFAGARIDYAFQSSTFSGISNAIKILAQVGYMLPISKNMGINLALELGVGLNMYSGIMGSSSFVVGLVAEYEYQLSERLKVGAELRPVFVLPAYGTYYDSTDVSSAFELGVGALVRYSL